MNSLHWIVLALFAQLAHGQRQGCGIAGDPPFTWFNATGSVQLDGIAPNDGSIPLTKWTWSTGFRMIDNSTRTDRARYQKAIWLDTDGVNLAAKDLPFNLLYFAWNQLQLEDNKMAVGDDGTCHELFSDQCITDWKARFSQGILKNGSSPAQDAADVYRMLSNARLPSSCPQGLGYSVGAGTIVPQSENCTTFGEGDPNLDTVTQDVFYSGSASSGNNDPRDLELYDQSVTRATPLLILAWSNNNSNTTAWSQAELICLTTPNITKGSRRPDGVPSAAARLTKHGNTASALVVSCFATAFLLLLS